MLSDDALAPVASLGWLEQRTTDVDALVAPPPPPRGAPTTPRGWRARAPPGTGAGPISPSIPTTTAW